MKKRKSLFSQYVEMLKNEFSGYGSNKFIADVIAGITVGAVALPLAIGFGASSVPNEHAAIGISAGLITAILAGIITGLLGGGSFQISGPTGTMSVILFGLVGGTYGFAGMFAAVFVAGIIRLLAGAFHLGKLVEYIPKPVVTGFTAGIALIIAFGQTGNFFGVTLEGTTTVEKMAYFFQNKLGEISVPALICAVATILVMMFYPKKVAKFVPGSLGALIVATVVVAILKIDIPVIGAVQGNLFNTEHLKISDFANIKMFVDVIGPAFSIAMLCMIETLLCGTCAAKMKKEEFNPNVELIGQGAANLVIAFFGGVPSTAALARTSVAIRAGGNTRIAGVFHSLFLLACMFVLSGAISLVPFAALAGVLVVTAVRMNDWVQIKKFFGKKIWPAIAQFMLTMLVTLFVDLTYAVLSGVALAFILLGINVLKLKAKKTDVPKFKIDIKNENGVATVKVSGICYFARAERVQQLIEHIDEYNELCLDITDVSYMDFTARDTMNECIENAQKEGKKAELLA